MHQELERPSADFPQKVRDWTAVKVHREPAARGAAR
jgi:hypothetical protein